MKLIDRSELFRKYQNQWIALTDNEKVISSGSTLEEALTKSDEKGFKSPLITKVPDLKYDYLL